MDANFKDSSIGPVTFYLALVGSLFAQRCFGEDVGGGETLDL